MKNSPYRCKNLVGQRFGRLTVVGMADTNRPKRTYWYCECDCGNFKVVRADSLVSGAIRSCGCLKREQDGVNLQCGNGWKIYKKRGFRSAGEKLYSKWQSMKSRCYDQANLSYGRYGARGIDVCDEWLSDYASFREWALANGYDEALTLDRIDNDKGYSPQNCRWTTAQQQARNRKSNINIKIGNSIRTLLEWCQIFDVNYSVVNARYHRDKTKDLLELFGNVRQYRGNRESGGTVEHSE